MLKGYLLLIPGELRKRKIRVKRKLKERSGKGRFIYCILCLGIFRDVI